MNKIHKFWLGFCILIIVLFLIGFLSPAYAQEETSVSLVTEPIGEFFEWFGNFTKANIQQSDLPEQKKDEIMNTADAGVGVAEKTINLWTGFHELIINAIFAGSPIEFDKGIAVMISFVVSTALVMMLLWKFVKHAWKWILAIVGFIAFILVLGIEAPLI